MTTELNIFAHVKKPVVVKKQGLVSSFLLRRAQYAYSNARVRTMKSLLLTKEFLTSLIRMQSVNGILEMLERTYYKNNLVKFSAYYYGSDLVQVASSLHFAEIVSKLERMISEEDRLIFKHIMHKWDIINLRTILHARKLGKKYEDIAPFIIPVGSFKESEIRKLLEDKGAALFRKFIKTEFGKELIKNKIISTIELERLFLKMGAIEIMKMESLFYLFYYSIPNILEKSGAKELNYLIKVLRKEIDLKNTSLIFYFKSNNIDTGELEKHFIKGGSKSFNSFSNMINAKDRQEMLNFGAKQCDCKSVPSSISELETIVNNKLSKEKLKLFYRSTPSIGTIVGFLFLKEEEINNLRKITIGKEFRVADEKIMQMLVLN